MNRHHAEELIRATVEGQGYEVLNVDLTGAPGFRCARITFVPTTQRVELGEVSGGDGYISNTLDARSWHALVHAVEAKYARSLKRLEWFELPFPEALEAGYVTHDDRPGARYFTDGRVDSYLVAEPEYPHVPGTPVPVEEVDPAVHSHGGRPILSVRYTPKRVYFTFVGHSLRHPEHAWFLPKGRTLPVAPATEPVWTFRLIHRDPAGSLTTWGAPEPGTIRARLAELIPFDRTATSVLTRIDPDDGRLIPAGRWHYRQLGKPWTPDGWDA